MNDENTMSNQDTTGDSPFGRVVERVAFEAWCRARWCGDRNSLGRNPPTGPYANEYTMGNIEFAWCAWQARASIGVTAPGTPPAQNPAQPPRE